jgi:hypothetical protein
MVISSVKNFLKITVKNMVFGKNHNPESVAGFCVPKNVFLF